MGWGRGPVPNVLISERILTVHYLYVPFIQRLIDARDQSEVQIVTFDVRNLPDGGKKR